MKQADFEPFRKALATTAEVYERTLSTEVIMTYWRFLKMHALADIINALGSHMQGSRFMPKPADILQRLPTRPLGVEEAWALALAARIYDESLTIVIEEAILESFPFSLYARDPIAARMAFKDQYPAAAARLARTKTISLGHDPDGREPVIVEALRSKRISVREAKRALPHYQFVNKAQAIEDRAQRDLLDSKLGEIGKTPMLEGAKSG